MKILINSAIFWVIDVDISGVFYKDMICCKFLLKIYLHCNS